jgi:hypothetical protein
MGVGVCFPQGVNGQGVSWSFTSIYFRSKKGCSYTPSSQTSSWCSASLIKHGQRYSNGLCKIVVENISIPTRWRTWRFLVPLQYEQVIFIMLYEYVWCMLYVYVNENCTYNMPWGPTFARGLRPRSFLIYLHKQGLVMDLWGLPTSGGRVQYRISTQFVKLFARWFT